MLMLGIIIQSFLPHVNAWLTQRNRLFEIFSLQNYCRKSLPSILVRDCCDFAWPLTLRAKSSEYVRVSARNECWDYSRWLTLCDVILTILILRDLEFSDYCRFCNTKLTYIKVVINWFHGRVRWFEHFSTWNDRDLEALNTTLYCFLVIFSTSITPCNFARSEGYGILRDLVWNKTTEHPA